MCVDATEKEIAELIEWLDRSGCVVDASASRGCYEEFMTPSGRVNYVADKDVVYSVTVARQGGWQRKFTDTDKLQLLREAKAYVEQAAT